MNKSFYNFEKIEVRGLFYFNFFNRNVQSKYVCQLAYNGKVFVSGGHKRKLNTNPQAVRPLA